MLLLLLSFAHFSITFLIIYFSTISTIYLSVYSCFIYYIGLLLFCLSMYSTLLQLCLCLKCFTSRVELSIKLYNMYITPHQVFPDLALLACFVQSTVDLAVNNNNSATCFIHKTYSDVYTP